MSTLRQDIVDLRRSIARNHAALPALTRLLDFNEKAIVAMQWYAEQNYESATHADGQIQWRAQEVLDLLDKENS
jgi:hypothetical protein